MTQVAFAPRRNSQTNMDTAADCFHSDIVTRAVTIAALALEIATWADIDGPTFDACDALVREAGSVGEMNRSHLRKGYNPPADLSILETARQMVDTLGGRVFVYNVPALADYRDRMMRCAMDIGALVCARLRSHGEAPPQWAVDKFKAGH